MKRYACTDGTKLVAKVAVYEVTDAQLETLFANNPKAKDITGVPAYWSPKHGYWPKPGPCWKIIETED